MKEVLFIEGKNTLSLSLMDIVYITWKNKTLYGLILAN